MRFRVLVFLVLASCASPPPPDVLVMQPVSFSQISGWGKDAVEQAMPAWLRSCERLYLRDDAELVGVPPAALPAAAWKEACRRTANVNLNDTASVQQYFEKHFTPYRATNNGNYAGIFTGYYEPLIFGSRTYTPRFRFPVYRLPDDVVPGTPYYSRAEIYAGALKGRGLEIAWVDDPVMLFFLEVQGSGRIQLPDEQMMRIGFAGKNNREYFAIGRALVEREELTIENVSMQTIREWLKLHPDQAQELMEENEAFVFFRELQGDGPIGSQQVALTPERSVAVDANFIPLGAPLFIDTMLPMAGGGPLYQRLVVAQDTGGAIKGPVRADIFFGFGERAEGLAGFMKAGGGYYLLLPNWVHGQ